MSLEGLFIGLIGLVLGAAFTFGGFRFFMILLPIWGLFVGFTAGADAVSILVALLSWFYWWGAIIVLAGWLGYEAVHWLLVLIGMNPTGFIPFAIALVVGVVVAIGAFALNVPKLVALVLT